MKSICMTAVFFGNGFVDCLSGIGRKEKCTIK